MNKWEKSIREKTHASGILTNGEWVYLVGAFQSANELDQTNEAHGVLVEKCERLRAALQAIHDIENKTDGGDWDEIEDARLIVRDALGIYQQQGGAE